MTSCPTARSGFAPTSRKRGRQPCARQDPRGEVSTRVNSALPRAGCAWKYGLEHDRISALQQLRGGRGIGRVTASWDDGWLPMKCMDSVAVSLIVLGTAALAGCASTDARFAFRVICDGTAQRISPDNLCLDYEGTPCWFIQNHRDPASYLIVRGDCRVAEDLESVAREKKCTGFGGRPPWRRQRRRLAPTEQQSSPQRRHAHESTSQRAIWNPEWISPYESALYVLVKYLRANPTRNREWKTEVFSPYADKPSLLTGQGIVKPIPALLPGAAVLRGVLSTYAPRWRCKLHIWDHFKFCPDCLALGYHSIFFQLAALVSCPIHRVALVSSCAHCHDFTPRCEPQWYEMEREYRCFRCSPHAPIQVLTQQDWTVPHSMWKLLNRRLTPIAEWLTRAERTHRLADVEAMRAPIPELQLDAPWAFAWCTARPWHCNSGLSTTANEYTSPLPWIPPSPTPQKS
jgi:hypothetical protein